MAWFLLEVEDFPHEVIYVHLLRKLDLGENVEVKVLKVKMELRFRDQIYIKGNDIHLVMLVTLAGHCGTMSVPAYLQVFRLIRLKFLEFLAETVLYADGAVDVLLEFKEAAVRSHLHEFTEEALIPHLHSLLLNPPLIFFRNHMVASPAHARVNSFQPQRRIMRLMTLKSTSFANGVEVLRAALTEVEDCRGLYVIRVCAL